MYFFLASCFFFSFINLSSSARFLLRIKILPKNFRITKKPKIIKTVEGKIGNKGRTKEVKWDSSTSSEKKVYHELRDKLIKMGYSDNAQRALENKKKWRNNTLKKINKSKSTAEKKFNHDIE